MPWRLREIPENPREWPDFLLDHRPTTARLGCSVNPCSHNGKNRELDFSSSLSARRELCNNA
ncbi:MAG: hypothetical protein ABSB63_20515, partial [Spirochaetia bacterium]